MFEKLFFRSSERRRGRSPSPSLGFFAVVASVVLSPFAAWGQPVTPEARLEVVRDHYATYAELLALTNDEPPEVQVVDYVEISPAKWRELALPDVLSLDVNRRLRLDSGVTRSGAEPFLDLKAEVEEVLDGNAITIHDRWVAYGLPFDRLMQDLTAVVDPTQEKRLIPLALGAYRVTGMW
ncbi:MAG: hypothetical protein AAFX50_22100, partial [Acidobacteriota bacterium]